MDRTRATGRLRLPTLLRTAFRLSVAGGPLLLGCAALKETPGGAAPAVVRGADADLLELPKPQPPVLPHVADVAAPAAAEPPRVLPVDLDAVMRLAEENNAQLRLCREKVRLACAAQQAAGSWLPDLYVGPAYYRHEGGIQDQDGTLIRSSTGALFGGAEVYARVDVQEAAFEKLKAERAAWQQKGECSRLTSEKLLEATGLYVDLLTARAGEVILLELEADLQDLLKRAEKLAEVEPAGRLETAQLRAEIHNRRQTLRQFREQFQAAAARLAYLLDVEPCVQLQPIDQKLTPMDLIDANRPACDLVTQALANGPGVKELNRLLEVAHRNLQQIQSRSTLLPTFEVRMAEGGFGAGSGSGLDWDNRWDLGVQARWNVTGFTKLEGGRRAAESQIHQVHLAQQDLRGRLTSGVEIALEQIRSGREQFAMVAEQLAQAQRFLQLARDRLQNNVTHNHAESMNGLQLVAQARVNYLKAVQAYNKAQLQLLILLGPGCK